MSWRQEGNFDPHGGRNAFRCNDEESQSSTERVASMRAMRSFTESIEDDIGPPELPPSLDIDNLDRSSMKTSDTNDTIVEVKTQKKVDPQLGETQKYKMAVPGPGHSEQEQELHKSLIHGVNDEEDAEISGFIAPTIPPNSLSFSQDHRDPTTEELRRAYDQKIRKRPTTPTSSCVLDGIAFFAEQAEPENITEAETEKIKVSIPTGRRRKTEQMSYSEFYESMSSQIPGQVGRRMSASGRVTPMNDYEGDILDENPIYKDKAPPAPVVHRRSSIEWENFADMEDKMEQAEKKGDIKEDQKNVSKCEMENEIRNQKKLAFKAKPPTVEITSPDAPHQGAFHEQEKVEVVHEEENIHIEDEDDDQPTFSEDMDEERQRAQLQQESSIQHTEQQTSEQTVEQTAEETQCDPNAYPGYIWNYETQQWEYDPNYYPSAADNGYDQTAGNGNQGTYSQYDYYQGYEQSDFNQGYQGSGEQGYQGSGEQGYTGTGEQGYQGSGEQGYPGSGEQGYQGSGEQGYQGSGEQGYPGSGEQGYQGSGEQGYQGSGEQGYTGTGEQGYPGSGEQGYPGTGEQGYQGSGEYNYAQGYQEGFDQSQYYQKSYPGGYNEAQTYQEAYPNTCDQTNYEQSQTTQDQGYDPTQEYDYSAYGGYEGYVAACKAYEDGQNVYQGYGDAYQGYGGEAVVYEDYSSASQGNNEAPVVTKPLFEQAPEPADPYAWDVQEAAPVVSKTPEEIVEQESVKPARPPPARPEAPKTIETTEEAPARPPPVTRPPPPRPAPVKKEEPVVEEDAWAQFKKMTEKVSDIVKTTETTLKTLTETSAANDIRDESYFAQIGGSQGFVNEATQKEIQRLNEEKKMAKLQKKKLKQQGKKTASPPLDIEQEDAMDRAAQELAMKLASMRSDIGDWKAPELPEKSQKATNPEPERKDSAASAIPPRKKSSIKDVQQDSGGSLELPAHLASQPQDSVAPKGDLAPDDPILSAPAWADFEASDPVLPPSESGFFSAKGTSNEGGGSSESADPFNTTIAHSSKKTSFVADPFEPQQSALIDDSYDPFAVVAVEEVVAMAKAKAEQAAANVENDEDFYNGCHSPTLSTPTPEGGSPISQRPNRFEDDFKCTMTAGLDTPTPLYDEDDSQPLVEFQPKFLGDGWTLMVRHPIKKKSFMAERCWKPCYVRLHGTTLLLYNDKKDSTPIQELLLQSTYSLSDTTLQAYDVYGKIHTVKLQYVTYKEKMGIRPGQISRLVDGHITKYGLPLEHTAQCTVLLKFGSLDAAELQSFVTSIEDILFKCHITRTTKPLYKQDEVQIHCYDEYSAFVDKDGFLSDQRARVRMFCLAFLTGSPILEVGLNDRRRQGKEIVRRKDILPMYTERWIRFEELEFHSIVNREEFDKEQVISFSPPDGCFFEIMRFRVRPPRNREKAMTVKAIMKIAGSKVEIRLEAMAAAQIQRSRGSDERRQIPCEDIAIRFPIPEAWIYIFREERHWGVGSIHSKKLRPGKVKNLKDRLLGAVQASEPNLIECAIGEAKYEHVYRSLVWRIPRLPEKHHGAYKSHLLKCRFELSSFDLMPEEFLPRCDVDFTMPLATVSNTVVRSVSVEQHEDSDRVEKFVRYVAKYQYKVEIDYVQCANLDLDMADPSVNPEAAAEPVPELHQPTYHPDQNTEISQGYRIDFNEAEMGGANPRDDSSSDEEPNSHKMPIIQIDMKNYGY